MRGRGFRVNSRKFSVQRLRARFLYFIRNVIFKWSTSSCWVASIKRTVANVSCRRSSSGRRGLVVNAEQQQQQQQQQQTKQKHCCYNSNNSRLKSFGRSNSFYSEAIEDCLEFIKRSSSVSVDDQRPVAQQRYTDS
ncbi:hypothetical protein Sjap_009635 [Stephania japonica]|uniref:Uncharacterized protein n=1 Tax=Stephania japonica TaxID=461633 RepID=A0AAP0J814_9MAGN